MKDLNVYYTHDDEKNLNKTIKYYDYKIFKTAIPYMNIAAFPIYLVLSLLLGNRIQDIILYGVMVISINTSSLLTTINQIKYISFQAGVNLRFLTRLLKSENINVGCEDLKNSVILKDKSKELIQLKDEENNTIHNQKDIKKIEDFYFIDRDKYLRCLREIKEILVTNDEVEKTQNLYLLERKDFDKDEIFNNQKIKKYIKRNGLDEINFK